MMVLGRIISELLTDTNHATTATTISEEDDPTAWMINNSFADFIFMHSFQVRCMCLLGYAFYQSSEVFKTLDTKASTSFKFLSTLLGCCGGTILVPILINGIPVPIVSDMLCIAVVLSFIIQSRYPMLRDAMELSCIAKAGMVFFHETVRAAVLVQMTTTASSVLAALSGNVSLEDNDGSPSFFPLFGPIICGTLSITGGSFLPFHKGLDPIRNGLPSGMFRALISSTCLHVFLTTRLSNGIINAKEKAHVYIALFFIAGGLAKTFHLDMCCCKCCKCKHCRCYFCTCCKCGPSCQCGSEEGKDLVQKKECCGCAGDKGKTD